LKKSLKIASIVAVLILAVGIVTIVYANSQLAAGKHNGKKIFSPTNPPPPKPLQPRPDAGLEWFKKFVTQADATQISGTVESEFKGMLILGTDEGQVRILLPEVWSLNSEVMKRGKLFNSTFCDIGQTVNVKVLKSVLLEKDSFNINIIIAYEIINASETHAYAAFPFNIEPKS